MDKVSSVIGAGPFADRWESLQNYTIPDWYKNGKFGIFIHWGVYCVPAFKSEWYPRLMYQQGTEVFEHHAATYGPQKEFGYKDFIPLFTAERFDPKSWAELFKQAGARFVVPVAEHHDGFQMYESTLSRWNAARMGPKRDVIGELAQAVRTEGMVFGLSSHRAEHWWFFDGGMQFDSDVRDPRYFDLYGPAKPAPKDLSDLEESPPDQAFLEDWLARTCELVDRYRPQLVWFDWWIQNKAFEPYLRKFAAYYYNRGRQWNKGVAINHKYGAFPEGTAVLDIERGQLSGIRPLFWQTDTSISKNSWGYIKNHEYKTAADIICDLVDIVSKNGALLLNVGPKPDGTIPEPEQEVLRQIGRWLQVNGEAIYDTRPWEVFGEGPTQVAEGAFTDTKRPPYTSRDIRFTTTGSGTLYAAVMKWPEDGCTAVRSLGTASDPGLAVEHVELLGSTQPVKWNQREDGLFLDAGRQAPLDGPVIFKIRGR